MPTSLAAPPTLTDSCAEIKISQPRGIWYDSHQMSHITIQPAKIVNKPWGYEIIWAHTDRYVGKILHINKGESLSYQYHVVKDETIRLLSGALDLDLESDGERSQLRLAPGESLHIVPGMKHRMIAVEDCDVLEVSTPELDDVVRLEDRYGRADSAAKK
jgi:mannose-6-phosphate isomerase